MKHNRILLSVAMAAIMLVSICAVSASTLGVSAAQGSSPNVKAPPVVGAPVGAGAPGVCTNNSADLFLFIRGADNALYLKISPNGVTWPSTEVSLGGVLASAPAATSPGNGVIEVFSRGTDGRLYEKASTDHGATWSPKWISLGGQLLANTGPSACSWASGGTTHTELFVTGTDHRCYQMSQTGPSATAWHDLGGYLTSAPAGTVLSDGSQIGLFVAGTNGIIYYNHYTSTWSGWVKVGGTVLSGTSPAAYNFGAAQIGWFVTGTDSQLWNNWVGSGGSAGYAALGGVLTSSPSATVRTVMTGNIIDVFARGSTGQFAALYQITYNSGGSGHWGGWTAIGGV
jgi:hypothetical protein